MIGLDTNVLLRLFVEDDAGQTERARRHVGAAAADETCVVNSVVLAEFAWTLAKKMKRNRTEVAHLIEEVLSANDLLIPDRRAVERAIVAYSSGKADFPDYFLAEINRELGCASTATFDRAALDSSSFSSVPWVSLRHGPPDAEERGSGRSGDSQSQRAEALSQGSASAPPACDQLQPRRHMKGAHEQVHRDHSAHERAMCRAYQLAAAKSRGQERHHHEGRRSREA